MFGWLQVEEVVDLGAGGTDALARYPWLVQHPHVLSGWPSSNAIFIAKKELTLDGSIPGFGVFSRAIMLSDQAQGCRHCGWFPRGSIPPLEG